LTKAGIDRLCNRSICWFEIRWCFMVCREWWWNQWFLSLCLSGKKV